MTGMEKAAIAVHRGSSARVGDPDSRPRQVGWNVARALALALAGALGLALAACSSSDDASDDAASSALERGAFPEGFLFGTAVAGFQVEAGCPSIPASSCEDPHSDWFQWVNDQRIVRSALLHTTGDPLSGGPGFYETYRDDILLARRELRANAMRVSVEWSRIFPTATDELDDFAALRRAASADALRYYHSLFGAMRARGIEPLVTVHHYSLPTWIHDGVACHDSMKDCENKGWVDRERIVREIAKFAGFVGREFGGQVDTWITLNEPFSAVTIPGFLFPSDVRTNPPGRYLDVDSAKTATAAMIEAHARMVDALRASDIEDASGDGKSTWIGLTYAFADVHPASHEQKDLDAARDARYFMNDMFMNAIVRGELDENWDGEVVVRDDLKHRIDFVGVNYYFKMTAKAWWIPWPGVRGISKKLNFDLLEAAKADTTYTQGIYNVLMELGKYNLPLVITETGTDHSEEQGGELASLRWLGETVGWTEKAILAGADVRGYLYWSLMDNYEWNHGYGMRFGLYGIDPNDARKARQPRAAVPLFADIARHHGLSRRLRERFGFAPVGGRRPVLP